jgi:meso-butanediol dehydrogenase/(S,S)-butanediol dehydrogenase/diacetyl reductase
MVASRFIDQVVLVTGGGSGIGLACARRFAKEGAKVLVAQRTKSAEFETIQVDLSKAEDCQRVIEASVEKIGRLDVLVNNAGMMQESSIEDMSLEDWNRNLQVNLTAPFLLTKYALPHLRDVQGSIVNIGSVEGLGSNPQHAAYCACKAGLHGFTRAVAIDHGEEGVRCNAVAPGWIDTELNEEFIESMPNPVEFRKNIGKIHPIARTGKPEEVAALVTWLASKDASFVTGQIYTIDGGRMAKLSLPN